METGSVCISSENVSRLGFCTEENDCSIYECSNLVPTNLATAVENAQILLQSAQEDNLSRNLISALIWGGMVQRLEEASIEVVDLNPLITK